MKNEYDYIIDIFLKAENENRGSPLKKDGSYFEEVYISVIKKYFIDCLSKLDTLMKIKNIVYYNPRQTKEDYQQDMNDLHNILVDYFNEKNVIKSFIDEEEDEHK